MQKELRLRKNKDFQLVFRKGSSVANRQLVLYVYKNEETKHFRAGISVSKKIGRAVVRNKLKRRLKEIVRLHAQHIPQGVDLVLIVRPQAVQLTYQELAKSFVHLLKKAKLYQKR